MDGICREVQLKKIQQKQCHLNTFLLQLLFLRKVVTFRVNHRISFFFRQCKPILLTTVKEPRYRSPSDSIEEQVFPVCIFQRRAVDNFTSELPLASVSKRGLVQSLSYQNRFCSRVRFGSFRGERQLGNCIFQLVYPVFLVRRYYIVDVQKLQQLCLCYLPQWLVVLMFNFTRVFLFTLRCQNVTQSGSKLD